MSPSAGTPKPISRITSRVGTPRNRSTYPVARIRNGASAGALEVRASARDRPRIEMSTVATMVSLMLSSRPAKTAGQHLAGVLLVEERAADDAPARRADHDDHQRPDDQDAGDGCDGGAARAPASRARHAGAAPRHSGDGGPPAGSPDCYWRVGAPASEPSHVCSSVSRVPSARSCIDGLGGALPSVRCCWAAGSRTGRSWRPRRRGADPRSRRRRARRRPGRTPWEGPRRGRRSARSSAR